MSNVRKSLERRLKKTPMVPISIRIPPEMKETLTVLANRLGYPGYQPLARDYIDQGMKMDLRQAKEESRYSELDSDNEYEARTAAETKASYPALSVLMFINIGQSQELTEEYGSPTVPNTREFNEARV